MKKNYIFCACAAMALLFASCQKEGPASEGTDQDNQKQEETTPDAPSGDMSVITATTADTKVTTLDGVNMLWDKGDKIQLFTRTYVEGVVDPAAGWCDYSSSIETPLATATFVRDEANTNTVDNTSGKYFAIYKKGAEWTTQSRDYFTQIALDKELVVKNGGDFASTIMYATSEGSQFTFSHAVSYLKFTVDQNTTPFTKLTVSSVSDAKKVITRVKISWNDGDPVVEILSGNSQDSKTITLTTDDEAAFAPGTYYFAINPGTYADGFELSFENATQQVASVNTPANVVMEAGDVANLGTIGTLEFADAPDPLQLATVYEENGKKQGVVFWIDPDDPYKGKVISMTALTTRWSATPTYTQPKFSSTDPLANHTAVTSLDDYNQENYPAVYFCDDMRTQKGGNWHLPSVDELVDFGCTYYDVTSANLTGNFSNNQSAISAAEAFDAVVTGAGGTAFTGVVESRYWTGQEKIGGGKLKVCAPRFGNMGTAMSLEHATETGIARCVRDVEIQ